MALFAIETEDKIEVMEFFAQTGARLKGDNFLKNPFTGNIKRIGPIYILNLKPIYPNISPFFLLSFAGAYIIWGWHYWMIALLMLSASGFFWSKYFFYPIMKKGLRKHGYSGPINLISNTKALERVIELWGNER